METITVYVALTKGREAEGYFASEDKAWEVARDLYMGSVVAENIPLKDWDSYYVNTSLPSNMWDGV